MSMNMDKDIIVYLTVRPRSRASILTSMLPSPFFTSVQDDESRASRQVMSSTARRREASPKRITTLARHPRSAQKATQNRSTTPRTTNLRPLAPPAPLYLHCACAPALGARDSDTPHLPAALRRVMPVIPLATFLYDGGLCDGVLYGRLCSSLLKGAKDDWRRSCGLPLCLLTLLLTYLYWEAWNSRHFLHLAVYRLNRFLALAGRQISLHRLESVPRRSRGVITRTHFDMPFERVAHALQTNSNIYTSSERT